ncbi:MAG: hypothetical protein Q9M89_09915 [Persephonella sp.]|nr:hypothetical protein [Persephonella sp.]
MELFEVWRKMSPSKFINIAEETGLIKDISDMVLGSVLPGRYCSGKVKELT